MERSPRAQSFWNIFIFFCMKILKDHTPRKEYWFQNYKVKHHIGSISKNKTQRNTCFFIIFIFNHLLLNCESSKGFLVQQPSTSQRTALIFFWGKEWGCPTKFSINFPRKILVKHFADKKWKLLKNACTGYNVFLFLHSKEKTFVILI